MKKILNCFGYNNSEQINYPLIPRIKDRIIFLDVDGVLNSIEYCKHIKLSNNETYGVSRSLMNKLSILIESTESDVVLSSTWRLEKHKLIELKKELEKINVKIYSITPDLSNGQGDRVDEIYQWIENYNVKNLYWIALDDMDLTRFNPKIEAINFVKVSELVGLTNANISEAITKMRDQLNLKGN